MPSLPCRFSASVKSAITQPAVLVYFSCALLLHYRHSVNVGDFMITDKVPKRKDEQEEYRRSDAMRSISLPDANLFYAHVARLEESLKAEDKRATQASAAAIAVSFSQHFQIATPGVRVLGARPREVSETSVTETFGDYDFDTAIIRLWMRTGVLKKPTAFGTFLSTLCHELCHHLDVVYLELPNTFHTRGFFERAGLLYHHVRGTPVRPLVWSEYPGGRFTINWARTMRNKSAE